MSPFDDEQKRLQIMHALGKVEALSLKTLELREAVDGIEAPADRAVMWEEILCHSRAALDANRALMDLIGIALHTAPASVDWRSVEESFEAAKQALHAAMGFSPQSERLH